MRVVLWTRLVGRRFRARLESHTGIHLIVPDDFETMISAVRGSDVLVTDGSTYGARIAEALRQDAGSLRLIQLISTGYDGLTRHGVPAGVMAASVGSFYATTVAEHAMAMLLALFRQLPQMTGAAAAADRTIAGRLRSLEGATVAVVGFGGIGRAVAARARPFGARIVAVVQTERPEPLADEVVPQAQLQAALSRADAAVLAVALTDRTRHLIGSAELAACKRGMVLINVARGEVVDTEALAPALRDGQLAGAGLDVTDPEPLPADHPLWQAPNLIVSPHIGGVGRPDTAERLAEFILDNIGRTTDGRPVLNRIH